MESWMLCMCACPFMILEGWILCAQSEKLSTWPVSWLIFILLLVPRNCWGCLKTIWKVSGSTLDSFSIWPDCPSRTLLRERPLHPWNQPWASWWFRCFFCKEGEGARVLVDGCLEAFRPSFSIRSIMLESRNCWWHQVRSHVKMLRISLQILCIHYKVIARLGVDGIHIQQDNKACLNTMQHLLDIYYCIQWFHWWFWSLHFKSWLLFFKQAVLKT